MSDQSINGHSAHQRRTPKAEYATYFVLILLVALPAQTLVWLIDLVRHRHLPATGPLARALRDAEVITPAIFRP